VSESAVDLLTDIRQKKGERAMKYLVVGSGGPGFASPEEAVKVLEEIVLPSFDQLMRLEEKKKILAGGLPIGDRAFVFIADASSNEELDQMLRELPMWGSLDWEVTALQTFSGRADQERGIIKKLKK
jgi:muconolactone delta-isomerase